MAQHRYKAITEEGGREDMLNKFFQAEIRHKDEEALMELLLTPSGRWFLMRLLDAAKVNAPCFTGNSQTFYNEGRREVGLMLLNNIAALGLEGIKLKQEAEIEYIKMQQKAREIAADYADAKEGADEL
jgi:hypothetical protein